MGQGKALSFAEWGVDGLPYALSTRIFIYNDRSGIRAVIRAGSSRKPVAVASQFL